MNPDILRRLGWDAYRLIAKHHRFFHFHGIDAAVDMGALCQALVQEGDAGMLAALFVKAVEEDVQHNAQVAWCGGWGRVGLPQVSPSERLLASWMATSASPEAIDGVRLPWPYFLIVVPAGWFQTTSSLGTHAVTRICVSSADGRCRVALVNEAFAVIGAKGCPIVDLAELDVTEGSEDQFSEPIDEQDRRILRLAGRAVLGVAFEFDEIRHRVAGQKSTPVPLGRPAPVRDVRMHRVVNVDARRVVRDYASVGGRAPAVRSCVRGHWKLQPCGPQRSERRRIHVEPYWRGPNGAAEISHDYRVGAP